MRCKRNGNEKRKKGEKEGKRGRNEGVMGMSKKREREGGGNA